MYRWAYILQQAISHHLHSNNQVNLPTSDYGADQQLLLLPGNVGRGGENLQVT